MRADDTDLPTANLTRSLRSRVPFTEIGILSTSTQTLTEFGRATPGLPHSSNICWGARKLAPPAQGAYRIEPDHDYSGPYPRLSTTPGAGPFPSNRLSQTCTHPVDTVPGFGATGRERSILVARFARIRLLDATTRRISRTLPARSTAPTALAGPFHLILRS